MISNYLSERFSGKGKEYLRTEERFLSIVILFLALLLGSIVRWNFIAESDFPINDGGFFFSLIMDLLENKFTIPVFATYNLDDIPYAYPPLAFYLVGGTHQLTGISIMALLRWLPLGFSVLTIPAFYSMTRVFFSEEAFLRALATLFFATLPRSFEWFLMGGGITRSIGFLFSLLALSAYARAIKQDQFSFLLIFSGALSSLTFLSHPVAGIFLAFSLIVLTIYIKSAKASHLLIIGISVVVLTSLWWGGVIRNQGLGPFIGASGTGHIQWLDLGYLLTLNFQFENRFFLPLISSLAILGLFSTKRRKALFLGVFVGLGYFVIPRGGIDLLTVYLALLSTLGFAFLDQAWQENGKVPLNKSKGIYIQNWRSRVLLIFLIIYTFIGAYSYKYIDGKAELILSEGDFQAMVWIRDNTDDSARLVYLPPSSDYQYWWNDYFGEWLPALSGRHSVATVQGYEWLPGEFENRIDQYIELRSCAEQGVDCLENWVVKYDQPYNYLLLSRRQHAQVLVDAFLDSPDHRLVYKNADVYIFKKQKGQADRSISLRQ